MAEYPLLAVSHWSPAMPADRVYGAVMILISATYLGLCIFGYLAQ